MEEKFKNWLISRGYSASGAAYSYSRAIPAISEHYSAKTGTAIDIYQIDDQSKVSEIAHDYSQAGRFSDFGYEQHSRFRNAIARYSEYLVHHSDGDEDTTIPIEEDVEDIETDYSTNFAYERDLQTAVCSQVSDLFPGYKIFGNSSLGVEYAISSKRIDILLEHIESGNLLAIELKSGRADFRVFGQISTYLGLLKRQFPEKTVTGVIVAGEIDDSLAVACETNPSISTKIYRMIVELEDV